MATFLGRRGRFISIRGRPVARNSGCLAACCGGVCRTVYRAESCIPILPPVEGCEFTRPPDIYVCSDTLCDSDGLPVTPPKVVRVNGQCYQLQDGLLPRSAVPAGAFLYDLPTVECFENCDAPGCVPISPFSLAEPCNPACPPLYFCRSQFPQCRTIRLDRDPGPPDNGPGCCYKFDPAAEPAFPPPGAVVCQYTGPIISPLCEVIDFGNLDTTQIGFADCCECGDRGGLVPGSCNHDRRDSDEITGGLCDAPEELETCCPCPTSQTRIRIQYEVRIIQLPGSPGGGPTGFGNFTTGNVLLSPTAPQTGCFVLPFQGFASTINVQGPLDGNGNPIGTPNPNTEGPIDALYCPIRIDFRNTSLFGLDCETRLENPSDPNCPDGIGPGCPGKTCECLDFFYSPLQIRTRCICTFFDGIMDVQTTEYRWTLTVENPGDIPLGCEGGCLTRLASLLGLRPPRVRETLPFGIRGMVNVEEWL